jgi:hypothetical protein
VDFEKWLSAKDSQVSTKDSQVLWLSGPAECCIPDVSSRIIDLAKKAHPDAQHSVLYFFCSAATTKVPIAIIFVSAVVHQLVHCLPRRKKKAATTAFLQALLKEILREESLSDLNLCRFKAGDSEDAIVKEILKASSDRYWGALTAVMEIEREQGLSIIIDGLDKTKHKKYEFIKEVCEFIEYLRGRPSTTKVLLTSKPQPEIKKILHGLRCIEYDRERKGSLCLFFVLKLNNVANSCRVSEKPSL